jgi:uncharacterized protein
MTPDLNVLLAASRTDHPQHKPALAWLQDAVDQCATGGSIELLPMVTAGFLRLITNSKLFANPTPIGSAVAFVDSLLAVPGVEMPELSRVADAWIAAAVRTIGGHLVTFDKRLHSPFGSHGTHRAQALCISTKTDVPPS